MGVVGNTLDQIAERFPHLLRNVIAVLGFHEVADTALAGLAVDTNHVCLVDTAHIFRIDRQIRHVPVLAVVFLSPVHALGNCVLMRTAECGKYQLTAVRRTLINVHSGDTLVNLYDLRHVGEIQFRIHALRIHVQSQCDNVHVTGTLTVAEQGALDTVAAGKQPQFAVCHSTAAVVVGVQGDDDIFPTVQVVAHVFDLISINVRHGVGNRNRQIDDDRIFRCRFPDFQYGVADLQSEFRFGAGKAFRRILKPEVSLGLCPIFLAEICPQFRQLDDVFLALFEHLFPLCHGSGIIEVHNGMFYTLQGFKCLGNDVFPCLCQYLNGDIVRNHIVFNQSTAEFVFGFRSSRKADLDLLEADLYQIAEEFQLFVQTHRRDQSLIAVTQIDAAPDRCLFDHCLLCPTHRRVLYRKKLRCILFYVFHKIHSFPVVCR